MKIKNFEKLAQNRKRKIILDIIEAGLESIDTSQLIFQNIQQKENFLKIENLKINLRKFKRIFIIAVGKCALAGTSALIKILKNRIKEGVVIDLKENRKLPPRIKFFKGTHPFPSSQNFKATNKLIHLLQKAQEDDLILAIISGGGSTLLFQSPTLSPYQESRVIKFLMRKGADIYQVNTLRKHISLARGGFLAKYAYPARLISLIFSDVPKDNLEFIASGHTLLDHTTLKDAFKIIKKYNLEQKFNLTLSDLIETPKEKKYFRKVTNLLLGTNQIALKKMKEKAKAYHLKTKIVTSSLKGEARIEAFKIISRLKKEKRFQVLLYGGETTVKVK